MHATKVVMKDGRTIEGVLWTCCPEKGWVQMVGLPGGQPDMQIQLRDVESIITKSERIGINPDGTAKIGDDDVLARLRERWDGK